jgi:hypothetical protein
MSMIPMRMTRRLVRDPKLVAKKYFRMWFWIDFLSCTLKLSPLVVSTLPQYRVCLLPPPHAPHACAIAVGVTSAGLPLELSLQKSTGSNNLALVRAFRSPPPPTPMPSIAPEARVHEVSHTLARCGTCHAGVRPEVHPPAAHPARLVVPVWERLAHGVAVRHRAAVRLHPAAVALDGVPVVQHREQRVERVRWA